MSTGLCVDVVAFGKEASFGYAWWMTHPSGLVNGCTPACLVHGCTTALSTSMLLSARVAAAGAQQQQRCKSPFTGAQGHAGPDVRGTCATQPRHALFPRGKEAGEGAASLGMPHCRQTAVPFGRVGWFALSRIGSFAGWAVVAAVLSCSPGKPNPQLALAGSLSSTCMPHPAASALLRQVKQDARIDVAGIRAHPWLLKPLPKPLASALKSLEVEQAKIDTLVAQGAYKNSDADKMLEAMLEKAAAQAMPTEQVMRVPLSKVKRSAVIALPDAMGAIKEDA
eukprot:365661-Chlamydomonas_euryale.AAC.81